MRVWVLGGAGMLAQALRRRLQARGIDCVSSGREVDVRDPAALEAFGARAQPTAMVNCAAYTKVDACETNLDEAFAVNAAAPGHVGATARRLNAQVVHVSTDYVFAGDGQVPYDEQAACQPLGAYGRSKCEGEQAFWAALQEPSEGPPAYVVRTSWLFGHGGANFVRTMLRLLGERERLRVVADQVGRPTYCDDLADAIVGLLTQPAERGTYHFANAGATSWHQLTCAIAATARGLGATLPCGPIEPIKTVDYPTPARRPAYSVLCTDKISAALGMSPRPWEAALQAYLQVEMST
jgi:dTDP-4-dehydrorhamnose reductase